MERLPISPLGLQLAIFMLTALCVGGLLFVTLDPVMERNARAKARIGRIDGATQRVGQQAGNSPESRRKKLVEDTLKELDAKQKAKAGKGGKPTLTSRMRQAGIFWSRSTYFTVTFITGTIVYVFALAVLKTGIFPAAGFAVAAGLLLPHLLVVHKRNGRFKKFSAEFPNALDVIVRGVKSGMPLVDCLKAIASDAQEPVKGEFTTIIQDQTLGVPLDEALQRLADRVPISEANFFAIVIAIQSRTGGNLSEALGNLSKVLRDRKNLRGKIKAMSAEAKASAGIIGSMPIVVSLLLYFVSPDYISLLFSESLGHIVLAAAGVWMSVGIMVMRKMINFDF